MTDLSAPAVRWRRSVRARRISLRVKPYDRAVVVTLPVGVPEAKGLEFLHANTAWIARQLDAVGDANVAFEHGRIVMLDGVALEIRHCPFARGGAWREDDVLCVSGEAAFLPRRVTVYLRQEAARVLPGHVRRWAEAMQVAPANIALREVRSRWGSCTRSGRIMLSWRLVMAPPSVRDYIIIHELAHMTHFDHSPAFWAHVDLFCPGRHAAERWLKRHGGALLHAG